MVKIVFFNRYSYDVLDEMNYSFDYLAVIDYSKKEMIMSFENKPPLIVPYEKIIAIPKDEYKNLSDKQILKYYDNGKEIKSEEEFMQKVQESKKIRRKTMLESLGIYDKNSTEIDPEGIFNNPEMKKMEKEIDEIFNKITTEDIYFSDNEFLLYEGNDTFNKNEGKKKEFNPQIEIYEIDFKEPETKKKQQNTKIKLLKKEDICSLVRKLYKQDVFSDKMVKNMLYITDLNLNKRKDLMLAKGYLFNIIDVVSQEEKLEKGKLQLEDNELIDLIFNVRAIFEKKDEIQMEDNSKRNIILVDASYDNSQYSRIGFYWKNQNMKSSIQIDNNLYRLKGSTDAEKLAIFIALNFAKINKLDNVVILNDNDVAIQTYQLFYDYTVTWLPRELNEIADNLSKSTKKANYKFEISKVFGNEIIFSEFFKKDLK